LSLGRGPKFEGQAVYAMARGFGGCPCRIQVYDALQGGAGGFEVFAELDLQVGDGVEVMNALSRRLMGVLDELLQLVDRQVEALEMFGIDPGELRACFVIEWTFFEVLDQRFGLRRRVIGTPGEG